MPPKFFDIHTHLNFGFYSEQERDDAIKRALDAGVWLINVGSDFESSKRAIEIAEKYEEGVYATVGLHPTDNLEVAVPSDQLGVRISKLREMAKHPKVVGIGECGLDYKMQNVNIKNQNDNVKFKIKEDENKEKENQFEDEKIRQKEIFKKQIELAIEVNKPLMIHVRDAHDDVIQLLTTHYKLRTNSKNGNIHFFSGTPEQAQKYFDLGFTISFTGVITFARDYDEVIKFAPLDKIMIETDAPFVTPIPYRGQKNQPLFVREVAKKIAEIKGISVEEVCEVTTKNAMRFVGLI